MFILPSFCKAKKVFQEAESTDIVRHETAESSLQVLREFDPNSGALILEEEVREAVIKTAGAAVGNNLNSLNDFPKNLKLFRQV